MEAKEEKKHSKTTHTLPSKKWIKDSIVMISNQHVINITCENSTNSLLKGCTVERIKKGEGTSNREKVNLEQAAGIQFTADAQDSCLIISKQGYHPMRIYFQYQKEAFDATLMTDLQIQFANSSRAKTSKIEGKNVFLLSPKQIILFNTLNH